MAFPTCSGGYSPRWSRHDCLWTLERPTHNRCTVLWRVSVFHTESALLTRSSQPFWADMVAAAGAGPRPISSKALDSPALQAAIHFCLTSEAAGAAEKIALKMRAESGVEAAVASFHRNLPRESLRCDILPHYPAVWIHSRRKRTFKLSRACAEILVEHHRIDRKELEL